jgi:hypothetical protein
LGDVRRDALEEAVPMLWHAFLFLGLLGFFLFSSFCLVASTAFSYKNILKNGRHSFGMLSQYHSGTQMEKNCETIKVIELQSLDYS